MQRRDMVRWTVAVVLGVCAVVVGSAIASNGETAAPDTVVVAVPAQAGPVDGVSENSDEFIWKLLTQFAAPAPGSSTDRVVFETWASDADTFSKTPAWPEPDAPRDFRGSVLASMTTPGHGTVDVPCNPPGNAAVGAFPTSGTPTPCIAEEVRRNRPQFDYIVNNKLNTKAGLAAAYQKGLEVTMPDSALAVKGDYVPLPTLLQWVPELGTVEKIRDLYHTTTSDSVEYALVSIHVSSRQNPDWVWGTFEHQKTPGRCDGIGCFDTFGAEIPAVHPRATPNSQYGPCPKTPELEALMEQANLSPVWQNYCLKSTQVDYNAPDGTPYVLGNAVIERITGNGTVSASSCMGCHVYASFGPDGAPTASATEMLPYNPTGEPIPGVLEGSVKFDFMWGVLLAP